MTSSAIALWPRPEGENALRIISRHHRLDYSDLAGCAHLVFVIRDRFERLVSGLMQQVMNRALDMRDHDFSAHFALNRGPRR